MDECKPLAAGEPRLMSLTSDELHPASWVSIAWYPIYRIPVGRSLRDLSACFLTYHALSTAGGTGGGGGAGGGAGGEAGGGGAEGRSAGRAGGSGGGGGDGVAGDGAGGGGSGGRSGSGGESRGVEAAGGGGDSAEGSAGAGAAEMEARSAEWMMAGGCPSPPPVSVHGEAAMVRRCRLTLSNPS